MSLHSITPGGKFPQLVGSQLRLSPSQCVSELVLGTSHFSCLLSFARLSVQFPPQRALSRLNEEQFGHWKNPFLRLFFMLDRKFGGHLIFFKRSDGANWDGEEVLLSILADRRKLSNLLSVIYSGFLVPCFSLLF